MKSVIGKCAAAIVLTASVVASATPADARSWRRHHHHGGDDAAIAIGAGIIGLGLGAALASDRG